LVWTLIDIALSPGRRSRRYPFRASRGWYGRRL